MSKEVLRPMNFYKVESEENYFNDDEFLLVLHARKDCIAAIIVKDEDIDQFNLACQEGNGLPIVITNDFMRNNLFHLSVRDEKKKEITDLTDKDYISKLLEVGIFHAGAIHEKAYKRLLNDIEKYYEDKISIPELEDQIHELEGVRVSILDQDSDSYEKEKNEIGLYNSSMAYLVVDKYPYTEAMDSDCTVQQLIDERISPMMETAVPMKWF